MSRMSGCIIIVILLSLLMSASGLAQVRPEGKELKVDNLDKLVDIIRVLNWDREGPYTAQGINITRDIEITRSVILTANDIPIPASCIKRDDCRHAVTMVIPADMKSIRCMKTEDVLGAQHCTQAQILEKATFRLRAKLIDTHPWKYNFVPVLEFVQASTQGCRQGELQCVKDKTCWKNFNMYCRYCLGLPVEKCACRSEKGLLPDRTACSFFISGDLVCSGKCRDGQCEANDARCR